MKKPLVLLVDDDTTVLEALETLLIPRLEPICRVETFADPNAVLDSVPRWEEEDRQVAVAVVDQRMTGLSGVDLLVRLRGSPSAAHLNAILLTGYAGLESALGAKNTAGVDRYLEKPWARDDLIKSTKLLLASYMVDSGAGQHFIYRELEEVEEVLAHLRLRWEVYRLTAFPKHLLASNEAQIDADEYDPYSRFFGLFAISGGTSHLAATLRVTHIDGTPREETLERLLQVQPVLAERVRQPRSAPLPMMKYLIDKSAVQDLLDRIRSAGERAVEPGRLALDPGRAGRRLGLHIVASAAAFYFVVFELENALLTCVPSHVAAYRRLGFRTTEGTRTRFHEAFGEDVACLHGRREIIPDRARPRLESLAARARRTGSTCQCATFPACLPGPYETGEFVGTDLFCPMLAAELIGRDSPSRSVDERH